MVYIDIGHMVLEKDVFGLNGYHFRVHYVLVYINHLVGLEYTGYIISITTRHGIRTLQNIEEHGMYCYRDGMIPFQEI